MSEAFQRFTVSSTAYLRNLDPEDIMGECIAIHHQTPPVDNGDGTRSISLCFPTLIVSAYCAEPTAIAERVAAILNKHWAEIA